MAYIKGKDKRQYTMFPECIDDYVESDSPVRLFDAFVDSLNMDELGFIRSTPKEEGRPGYDPRDLLRIYIYGYFYSIRSSRRLERECKCNIEIMWLTGKLTPDFRTISDFRKDNKDAIKKIFKEFNRFCFNLQLFSKSFISIDGSKFKAVNSKDRNFTLSKLDDRIKRLDEHIALYMAELEACDQEENRRLSKEELEHKLNVCQQRRDKYNNYREQTQESGESQMSLTDPDARLMKQNEGFGVCYNTQTAVDAESHLIAGFEVTNNPTDHGQITKIASDVKSQYGTNCLEVVADKGYECPKDQANALLVGIVPNVITRSESNITKVSFEYKEAAITEVLKASSKPEDLKVCLEAGVIPDIYENILSEVEIKDRATYLGSINVADSDILKMTHEQMRIKAMEGYFVRDANCNLVYCPAGNTLRQKSIKRNGNIRYYNKLACKQCKNKCTKSAWKEVDFNKDILIKSSRPSDKKKQASKQNITPSKKIVKTVVNYTLNLAKSKMEQRKCLSEHPFGTIKRTLGSYYFLLKSKTKVETEMALFCLSYNMRRAITMLGVKPLIAQLA